MRMRRSRGFIAIVGRLAIGLLGVCMVVEAMAQTRVERKQAITYFQNGQYLQAADLLKAYCDVRPKDYEASYFYAAALFELNQLDAAVPMLKMVIKNERRIAPQAVLKLAYCRHQQQEFDLAIKNYKSFLASTDIKNPNRQSVINNIKRAAVGLKHDFVNHDVLVENMGREVNSRFHDFGPIESPNVTSRVYFSSMRSVRMVDRFGESGDLIGSSQGQDCDMFATEISNGAWSTVEPLNAELNTNDHEILADFANGGNVILYSKSSALQESIFYSDTFSDQNGRGGFWGSNPFNSKEVIRGFHMYNDSLAFFSSNRPGGLGGYDVYMAHLDASGWSEAINMGEKINSRYDEVTPFLALDGRTFYYSANGLNSMGGFDVFQVVFNESTLQWSKSTNLSLPINSAGNDLYYRLSLSGQSAYFSSDRKSGHGGQDLYSVYFKTPQDEQQSVSVPAVFYEVEDFQLFNESLVDANGERTGDPISPPVATFDVPSLLYRDDEILTPQNIAKLEVMLGFLKTYPHIAMEIMGFSDQDYVTNFDLYFSIKRAEQVATYLYDNGIAKGRIYLKGMGGSYPIAKNRINDRDNQTGRFYNRRLDFRIHQTDQLPLHINYDLPVVIEIMKDQRLLAFYKRVEGLTYRVEFAMLDQLFKGDLVSKYPDPSVERVPKQEDYSYTSGLFSRFENALLHLGKIKLEGFGGATIVAYIDGLRISEGAIDEPLIDSYRDLRNYILYLN